MKIRIDKNGYIKIRRPDKWASTYCPFQSQKIELDGARCGDWCPLFDETERVIVLRCAGNYGLGILAMDERERKAIEEDRGGQVNKPLSHEDRITILESNGWPQHVELGEGNHEAIKRNS